MVLNAADISPLTNVATALLRKPSVAYAYCSAIKVVCRNPANHAACGQPVVQAVLDIMAAHTEAVEVQQEATLACNNLLAGCDEHKRLFVSLGGLALLYRVAKLHLGSALLSRNVCGLTGAVASLDGLAPQVQAAGGIHA